MCIATENTSLLGSDPKDVVSPSPRRSLNVASHLLVFVLGISIAIFLRIPTDHISSFRHHSNSGSLHGRDIPLVSKYTHFQGLGYEIFTGAASAFLDDDVKNPECVGLGAYGEVDGDLECYLGLQNDSDDVTRRLSIMKFALEKAYQLSDPSNTTLKLFNAPEFFFRGKNGAYNITHEYGDPHFEACHAVCQTLKGLETLVADEKFKDWLFLFGTVIASDTRASEDHESVFVNFAPVYRGYDPATSSPLGKRLIVPKRYVSREDFLTIRRKFNESLATEIFDDPMPYQATVLNPFEYGYRQYNNDQWKKYKGALTDRGYAMVDFDFFVMDNITFSIEICLDHDKHSAHDVFMANLATGSKKRIPYGGDDGFTYGRIPDHQAQISLVSSGGITVNPESLVLANNGYIFLQDGLNNETSEVSTIDQCGIKKLSFDGGSELVSRFAVLTETDVVFEYRLTKTSKKVPVYETENEWMEALRGMFTSIEYEPMINVYDPVPITPAI